MSQSGNPKSWRLVDVATASVIGVTAGIIFWLWGLGWSAISTPVDALLPGVGAAFAGVWLFAGVLGGLVIRKPGAALLTEVIAAAVSAFIGSQWGITALWSGLVQGLGAELIFAIFAYRIYRSWVAVLAGAGAGLAMGINDLLVWYPGADALFNVVYIVAGVVGGAVIAGFGSWWIYRGLAAGGALRRLNSGS